MTAQAETRSSNRWRALLRAALIVLIAVGVLVHVYVQVPIPPIIVFLVLFGVVLYLLGREGRPLTIGVILGGVGALLFLLGNLPIVIEDITHPDSSLAFIASGAGVVGSIIGFVAMMGAFRRWREAATRPIAAAGAIAVLAVIVVGVTASLGVDNDEREDGDVVLVAKDVDFLLEGTDPDREADTEVAIDTGGAVFVDNNDLYRHTFTVDALGIDEEIPASAKRRVVIDADPGEYTFVCEVSGHEDDMTGTLVVS